MANREYWNKFKEQNLRIKDRALRKRWKRRSDKATRPMLREIYAEKYGSYKLGYTKKKLSGRQWRNLKKHIQFINKFKARTEGENARKL